MKTILVIREFDDFSGILIANDFKVVNLPLIETRTLKDLRDFVSKLANIENYDGIFVTSRHAAQILADKLPDRNFDCRVKVYVLGRRGFEILQNRNLELFYEETAGSARSLLEKIPPKALNNKRFLFVRGDKSLRVVPDFLAQMASVEETVVYESREIKIEENELLRLREKVKNREFAGICFFSPSAAKAFCEQFGTEVLHQNIIATIGKTTAEFLKVRNLPVEFVSSKAAAEVFAVELIEYLGKGK